jgi:hypothetical protein
LENLLARDYLEDLNVYARIVIKIKMDPKIFGER